MPAAPFSRCHCRTRSEYSYMEQTHWHRQRDGAEEEAELWLRMGKWESEFRCRDNKSTNYPLVNLLPSVCPEIFDVTFIASVLDTKGTSSHGVPAMSHLLKWDRFFKMALTVKKNRQKRRRGGLCELIISCSCSRGGAAELLPLQVDPFKNSKEKCLIIRGKLLATISGELALFSARTGNGGGKLLAWICPKVATSSYQHVQGSLI